MTLEEWFETDAGRRWRKEFRDLEIAQVRATEMFNEAGGHQSQGACLAHTASTRMNTASVLKLRAELAKIFPEINQTPEAITDSLLTKLSSGH
jgi:hypothetical protein